MDPDQRCPGMLAHQGWKTMSFCDNGSVAAYGLASDPRMAMQCATGQQQTDYAEKGWWRTRFEKLGRQ